MDFSKRISMYGCLEKHPATSEDLCDCCHCSLEEGSYTFSEDGLEFEYCVSCYYRERLGVYAADDD